jgi:hypothetical protein
MKRYDDIVNIQLQEKILKEIRDVLVRMEKRLKVIEDSVKKEEISKQLLND